MKRFQFYLSSIKRVLVKVELLFLLSFNSTLVQLKVNADSSMDTDQFCFNSTLVQLKVLTGLQGKAQEISFNSTLVQLKVESLRSSGRSF